MLKRKWTNIAGEKSYFIITNVARQVSRDEYYAVDVYEIAENEALSAPMKCRRCGKSVKIEFRAYNDPARSVRFADWPAGEYECPQCYEFQVRESVPSRDPYRLWPFPG